MSKSAFPWSVVNPNNENDWNYDIGMNLRDYFAAKAMQGFIANVEYYPPDDIARYSYDMAKLMMEERKRYETPN